ncbi:MAG: ATP-grasp domain-containing protein, partial [Saprospiraceae bacterium]
MDLHEYQGKELLSRFGVKIQRGVVARSLADAIEAYQKVTADSGSPVAVVKAQLHAGGRGKGGGVKVVKDLADLKEKVNTILGMMLKTPQTPGGLDGPGKLVRQVLIAEDVYIPEYDQCKELYLSILTDRARQCNVIIYSTEGGMDIEGVAEKTPHLVHTEFIDPALGLQAFEGRKIAFNLGLSGAPLKNMTQFVSKVYKAFVESDATLLEINPVLINGNGEVVAVDCKASMDDNALYRHPDIEA